MASSNVIVDLREQQTLYPSLSEFMTILQDEGDASVKSGKNVMVYKIINEFSSKLVKKIYDLRIDGIDKNPSRLIKRITDTIVYKRKSIDISDVCEELQPYRSSQEAKKIYVILNNKYNAGFPIILKSLNESIARQSVVSDGSRLPNDALRVCGIMLDPKYRSAVSGIMANRFATRAEIDLPVRPRTAFCELAVKDFNDAQVVVEHPQLVDELTDYDKLNPNDMSRINKIRDADWFWHTWFKYVKPKYRKYRGKWSKLTGGGPGHRAHFEEYCEKSKWVAWIFLLDKENGDLLGNNASSTVPNQMSNEAGYNTNTSNSKGKSPKNVLQKQAVESREQVCELIGSHKELVTKLDVLITSEHDKEDTPRTKSYKHYLDLRSREEDVMNDASFSPPSKKRYLDSINAQKKTAANIFAGKDSKIDENLDNNDILHSSSDEEWMKTPSK